MTAITAPRSGAHARVGSFWSDIRAVAWRALKLLPRDIEAVVPALVVGVFFYIVNTGTLAKVASTSGVVEDINSFQLPVAILFAITGLTRAAALTIDIQSGYFDRLLVTPVKRLALLLGLMCADVALVIFLSIPILGLGFAYGVRFGTGVLGVLAFVLIACLWSLAFGGFMYALALKTGNPAVVNSGFLLFFPFMFLTTTYLPKEALSGWIQAASNVNPVTYLLQGERSLITGWNATDIAQALLAIAVVATVSLSLALMTLRGRVKRD